MSTESDRVVVNERIMSLTTEQARVQVCGSATKVRACTRVVGANLAATCGRKSDSWSVQSVAKWTAVIALRDATRIRHERIHVEDMRRAVESWLTELDARTFSDEAACQAFAGDVRQAFVDKLREFANASNLARDGEPIP